MTHQVHLCSVFSTFLTLLFLSVYRTWFRGVDSLRWICHGIPHPHHSGPQDIKIITEMNRKQTDWNTFLKVKKVFLFFYSSNAKLSRALSSIAMSSASRGQKNIWLCKTWRLSSNTFSSGQNLLKKIIIVHCVLHFCFVL